MSSVQRKSIICLIDRARFEKMRLNIEYKWTALSCERWIAQICSVHFFAHSISSLFFLLTLLPTNNWDPRRPVRFSFGYHHFCFIKTDYYLNKSRHWRRLQKRLFFDEIEFDDWFRFKSISASLQSILNSLFSSRSQPSTAGQRKPEQEVRARCKWVGAAFGIQLLEEKF